MEKSNKELAVDVAIGYIRAHQKQIVATTGAAVKETTMLDLKSVNTIINSVYSTLESLDKSSNQ